MRGIGRQTGADTERTRTSMVGRSAPAATLGGVGGDHVELMAPRDHDAFVDRRRQIDRLHAEHFVRTAVEFTVHGLEFLATMPETPDPRHVEGVVVGFHLPLRPAFADLPELHSRHRDGGRKRRRLDRRVDELTTLVGNGHR